MYCKCTVLLELKKFLYFIILTIIKDKFLNEIETCVTLKGYTLLFQNKK